MSNKQLEAKVKTNIMIVVVSCALFMEAVDTTIINTAIPVMAKSLHVNPVDLKIALISYLLSLAIFIPISGWIADKFGTKQVFITALSIFTLSSAWCGFTHSLPELVLARCVQGLGGSLTLPVGRLILLRTYERHQLINVMSKVIMVASLGLMLGPVLGGFITHYFSWRWVFWVNIPVGIFAIIAAYYFLEYMPKKNVLPLDLSGFILFGSALAAFTFGLSALSETFLSDKIAVSIIAISVFLFMTYVIHSRKINNPVINVSLFQYRTFLISVLGNLFARFSFGGVPFLLPLLLQIGLGYNPQISGLLIAPMAVGVLLVKLFTFRLLRIFGYKRLLILNTTLVALCLWGFTVITSELSIYIIILQTFLFGLIIAVQYSGMNSLAYAELSPEHLSSAASIMGTLQQLAQSFGVALGAFLLRYYSTGSKGMFNLTAPIFHHVFFTMGIITLFSTIIFFQLKPGDGHEMIDPD
ncbi:MAG TPA: DHA2 family efflux MFS transporter permease subunit [Gammaproteobacteria bacterium]|nr:DHA2 family efflux MFS transporter permease subunit [Gammaproteobacteria bacterium]